LQDNRDEKKNHVKLKTPKERNEWKKKSNNQRLLFPHHLHIGHWPHLYNFFSHVVLWIN
jgi:hypothetical protein